MTQRGTQAVTNHRGVTHCDSCGETRFALFLTKNGYRLLRCLNCDLVFLDQVPNDNTLTSLYSRSYFCSSLADQGFGDYIAMRSSLEARFRQKLRNMSKMVKQGTLLDVGCGPGFFLSVARERYDVYGVDISPFAVDYAVQELRLRVFQASGLGELFGPETFDIITLWDTVEHLKSPKQILSEIHELLREEGLLVVQTGDVNSFVAKLSGRWWHLYNLPEHLYFFSRDTLANLLTKLGFHVVAIKYEWTAYSFGYLLERLFRISGVSWSARPFLHRTAIPVNLLDVMTLYARKITDQ